jgi:non-canonical purine NTP pyrophosphatase (RdgB/HAM1 family)
MLTFVTSNDHKAREASQILEIDLDRVAIDLDEIQDMDLARIVEHKLRQAYAQLQKPVIVEDVGLFFEAWNGFPGPFIKWIKETMGYAALPALLDENRRATWRVMYGYFDGTTLQTFDGTLPGSIASEPRGSSWGFDVIFIPDGETQTLAELGPERKNTIGARRLALMKLKEFLATR